MKLKVILRTCSGPNVHKGERFVAVSKEDLLYVCVASLVRSLAESASSADLSLAVIDDHSSGSCVQKIKSLLAACPFRTELISLEETGNPTSLRASYGYARNFAEQAIYFVEDDYLHSPSAISEMIASYEDFSGNLGGVPVAIAPSDDPGYYLPNEIAPSRVVIGRRRHWRTSRSTTGTFMTSKEVLTGYWEIFSMFARYGEYPGVTERNTINKIWENAVTLFSPIPSLAAHMQFSENIPPFFDWKRLWNDTVRWMGEKGLSGIPPMI